MGCKSCRTCRHGLVGFTILSLVFLVSSCSSYLAQGRASTHLSGPSKREAGWEQEMAIAAVKRIGSTPPKCNKKCSWCKRCEAIQVPMDPQESKQLGGHGRTFVGTTIGAGEYYMWNKRGEDGSNYKPMSWKCKCGEFILNP